MSRLLHAAARGARIEMLQCPADWVSTQSVPLDEYDTRFMHRRIHPDDAHLQYGPVSAALQVMASDKDALSAPDFNSLPLHAACAAGLDGRWATTWYSQTMFERSLALLILAEALADEGL